MVRHVRLGVPKLKERERAIDLRHQGLTYSEILNEVQVAKSTLSVWLGEVGLTTKQKQRITDKKRAGMQRGWEARHNQRVLRTENLNKSALQQLTKFRKDALFNLGLALYWAEGSKQKEWSISQRVTFSNMDVRTHRTMLAWYEHYLKLKRDDLIYQLYIDESADVQTAKEFWSNQLSISQSSIRVYSKKGASSQVNRNKSRKYHGVLRVVVPKSTDLNRTIAAWIDGMIEYVL